MASDRAHLQVGFVGLGTMGQYMARNLALHPQSRPPGSPPLLIFNRTLEKAQEFQQVHGEENIKIADSLGHLAEQCDVVLTSLANDAAVRDTFSEFVKALEVGPSYLTAYNKNCTLTAAEHPTRTSWAKDLRRDKHCAHQMF